MVLSYSRQIFLRFFLGSRDGELPARPRRAFEPSRASATGPALRQPEERRAGAARRRDPLPPDAARARGPLPLPAASGGRGAGQREGTRRRAIRYARENFFAARRWKDLDDLNAQAASGASAPPPSGPVPRSARATVREVFLEEKSRLLPLPPNPFPTEERVEVAVGRTPYVRFDLNDYSVPPDYVQRDPGGARHRRAVRIVDGTAYRGRPRAQLRPGQQIEDPAHVQALVDFKRQAREHRGLDRLHHAAPASHSSSPRRRCAAATSEVSLAACCSCLDCLRRRGARRRRSPKLSSADSPHLGAVRQILERTHVPSRQASAARRRAAAHTPRPCAISSCTPTPSRPTTASNRRPADAEPTPHPHRRSLRAKP